MNSFQNMLGIICGGALGLLCVFLWMEVLGPNNSSGKVDDIRTSSSDPGVYNIPVEDILKAKPPYIDVVTGDVIFFDGVPHSQAELLKKNPPYLLPCFYDDSGKTFGWCGLARIAPGDSVLHDGDYVRLRNSRDQ